MFEGFKGAFSAKGIGGILAVIVVLVLLERFNYGPSQIAAKVF